MKQIVILGARIETSDDIADAVLELACALAERGRMEIVEFPCLYDSGPSMASVLLGKPYQIATVRIPGSTPGNLDGSAHLLEELRRRTAELASV
ncbi:hypothetical protein ABZ477_04900 [Microbacterium sp. NPDC019599]|uniref:hypothetical protein n=1 Tax=Microbacterium sp. NPDC019599 TaxID=3154690 RepID=UPI0033C21D15